jgi:hypothetical protein
MTDEEAMAACGWEPPAAPRDWPMTDEEAMAWSPPPRPRCDIQGSFYGGTRFLEPGEIDPATGLAWDLDKRG